MADLDKRGCAATGWALAITQARLSETSRRDCSFDPAGSRLFKGFAQFRIPAQTRAGSTKPKLASTEIGLILIGFGPVRPWSRPDLMQCRLSLFGE